VPSLASASKCGVLASDAEKISLFSIDAALLISDLRALSSPSPTQTSRSLISGSSSLSSVSSSLFSDADHELSHLRRTLLSPPIWVSSIVELRLHLSLFIRIMDLSGFSITSGSFVKDITLYLALCFHIVNVLEFVAKKESLQLPHGFTALQVLLGNIREALQFICLRNCPTDELFYPGDKDTEAHELFGSYVSIITWSFKSQLIPFYRSSSRRRVNGELEDEPLHRNIIITEKDDCYSFNKTLLQTLFIRHSIMIIETKADL
uniref:Uncharacterized protein n=1 Tax=Brassica oleracea var. oleracea TaxID=109376 RepID=A0A0D3BEB0_BRAOL